MSYDIYFVRRDPGQSFEDALDELESEFPDGDPEELTDDDLEWWDELVPLARDILGEIDVADDGDTALELAGRESGIELTLISGEVEIHLSDPPPDVDELELMSMVYELARAVEDVTGLEGYDPQVGEPIRDRFDSGEVNSSPVNSAAAPDDEEQPAPGRAPTPPPSPVGDARPEMAPDSATERPRRWWEFWRA